MQHSIPNFILKTFEILDSSQYFHIISWVEGGREFSIKNIADFERDILPKYFRHGKINSFIRQLNMYGFHKSRREPTKNIFSHPFFIQNKPLLLSKVTRKRKDDKISIQGRDEFDVASHQEDSVPCEPKTADKFYTSNNHSTGLKQSVNKMHTQIDDEFMNSPPNNFSVPSKEQRDNQASSSGVYIPQNQQSALFLTNSLPSGVMLVDMPKNQFLSKNSFCLLDSDIPSSLHERDDLISFSGDFLVQKGVHDRRNNEIQAIKTENFLQSFMEMGSFCLAMN